jgi:hypothetical protein
LRGLPSRPPENLAQHPLRELSGEGVLLARVVRGVEHRSADLVASSVSEPRLRPGTRCAPLDERTETRLERKPSEGDDHARVGNERDLVDQVFATVRELLGERPVLGRSALDRRRQQGARELEPVSGPDRLGTVRETDGMNRAEKEVARLVSGEDPPRPVAAVRRGRQPDDQQTRPWIAERGKRPAPVLLAAEAAGRTACGLLAPRDEAWTPPARDDAVGETPELAPRIA